MLSTSVNTTNLKNRNELKSLFKNNTHLSASHFAELIISLLNKKEDKFHGVWKPGQSYQKGDVVHYQGVLWEMITDQEICAKDGEEPHKNHNWKSQLRELEQKVDKIRLDLETLSKEFTEYKQQMDLRWQQLLKYLTLLSLGIAIALVWLFSSAIYHLFFAG
ncbi:carbohydrate-binding protein [Brunnivagina elsteri]|uniref:Carbohydrate-binding protein n=1 Tax=Brunnivagina elsteri CCALA 953 TaxID=987040 RepID=A0A2A2TKC8_9CYAN|nr:carbohydrate-binding protein [Calothrix elsteri]PAX56954.1 carbohydrate-binding protein [Calothrix elsteri CCALA 953]